MSEVIEYKSWVCLICGWVYNEQNGLPGEGIAPGTRFADIPAAWRCPECDVGKEDFVVVEF
ncbi:rubredoxin [Caballeronia sp. Lep1P3]|uniref:rubredoxin n=1 Tax=Caballeronia sp. Lep1P3 TaxID=2878150 RepID=UPI001FD5FEA0|nr:rubredoxin [Caballeronia sp. Lep1P3]